MHTTGSACSRHLEVADDDQPFEQAWNHMIEGHPETEITDEQMRNLVDAQDYDEEDIWSPSNGPKPPRPPSAAQGSLPR